MKKTVLCVLASSAALLAAMGLAFLWCCPEVKWQAAMLGAHRAFWRQLCWNAVGIAAFCTMLRFGWRRTLRAAPFVVVGWVAMLLVAEFFCPMVNGELYFWHKSVGVGVKVMALLPLVAALALAWVSDRFKIKAHRLLLLMVAATLLVMVGRIATNANRVERIKAFFRGDAPPAVAMYPSSMASCWAQKTCVDAVRASRWFSGDEGYLRNNPIPGRLTFAMPAAASLTFGRWFLVLAGAGFAALLWCFVRAFRTTTDYGKRVFLVVAGLGVFVPAIQSTCECLCLTPMLYTCVPLVSSDGTLSLATWTAIGVFAAMAENDHV